MAKALLRFVARLQCGAAAIHIGYWAGTGSSLAAPLGNDFVEVCRAAAIVLIHAIALASPLIVGPHEKGGAS